MLVVWAALCVLVARAPALAQPAPTFLTRAAFSFDWAGLSTPDPRFTWESRVRVDLDVLDTGKWRLALLVDYDAVIGGERRPFDLNQGNYVFEGTASRRFGATEISLLTRHASRHLVDRENPPSISWNLAGARASHTLEHGRSIVSGEIELGRAMQQAYVDYLWMSDLRLMWRYRQSARLEWVGRGEGGVIGTMFEVGGLSRASDSESRGLSRASDSESRGRPRICGGRLEGAMRINGRAAAVELFVAYERRMDAYPTDRFRVRFTAIGFRLRSR